MIVAFSNRGKSRAHGLVSTRAIASPDQAVEESRVDTVVLVRDVPIAEFSTRQVSLPVEVGRLIVQCSVIPEMNIRVISAGHSATGPISATQANQFSDIRSSDRFAVDERGVVLPVIVMKKNI